MIKTEGYPQNVTQQYGTVGPKDRPSTRLDVVLADLMELNDLAASLCANKAEHNERLLGGYPAMKGQALLEPAAPPAGIVGNIENFIKSIRGHLVVLREYEDFTQSSL